MTAMPIKDGDIIKIVDKINEHYTNNITNRFLRKALLILELPQSTWDTLDGFSDKATYGKLEGFKFHELYDFIVCAATFVHHAKKDIKPRLKSILVSSSSSVLSRQGQETSRDKVLKDMAISNFGSNLSIFADLVNELYLKTVAIDKEKHPHTKRVYEKNPDLQKVGQYLVDS